MSNANTWPSGAVAWASQSVSCPLPAVASTTRSPGFRYWRTSVFAMSVASQRFGLLGDFFMNRAGSVSVGRGWRSLLLSELESSCESVVGVAVR